MLGVTVKRVSDFLRDVFEVNDCNEWDSFNISSLSVDSVGFMGSGVK